MSMLWLHLISSLTLLSVAPLHWFMVSIAGNQWRKLSHGVSTDIIIHSGILLMWTAFIFGIAVAERLKRDNDPDPEPEPPVVLPHWCLVILAGIELLMLVSVAMLLFCLAHILHSTNPTCWSNRIASSSMITGVRACAIYILVLMVIQG